MNTTLGGNLVVKISYVFTNPREGNRCLKDKEQQILRNSVLYKFTKYQNYLSILQKGVDSFMIMK